MKTIIQLIIVVLILFVTFFVIHYSLESNSLTLSSLDIFFVITTLTSIIFNVIQWRDTQNRNKPIKSMLIALFNDIKQKQMHAYRSQDFLVSPSNPHKDIATLRFNFYDYLQTNITFLEGFRETVTGILVSIDPYDRIGKETFNASNYGISEEEKKKRDEFIFRDMNKSDDNPA